MSVPIYLRPRRGRALSVLGRGLAGRTVFGPEKTNARWGRGGSGPPDDRAGWWAYQSYRRRSGIRLLVIFGPFAVAYGAVVDPAGTARLLREIGLIALALTIMAMIHWTRRWSHYKTWIVAVALTAGMLLDVSRHRRPRDWVHVPVGHREDPDKPIVIDLPEGFSWPQSRREKLAQAVANTGGIQHSDWYIDDEARPPQLVVRSLPQPPKLVTVAEMLPHYARAADDEIVWGLKTGRVPYPTSLATDAPHILCSLGSGGGKTEFLCGLCLQFLHKPRPARIIYLDFVKRGASAKWAKDIAGIEVVRSVAYAHDLILSVYEEVQARCESYWHRGYDPDEQTILIVMDEANRSYKALQKHWVRTLGGTKTSPAIDAYEGILFVGREANTHCATAGQRASHTGTGGGDSREAYGVIAANRYSKRTARMLFADVGEGRTADLPVSSNHPGRVQVVTGGVATQVQVPLCIDRRTKELLPAARAWLDTAPLGAPASGDPMTPYPALPAITVGSDPGSGHGARRLHVVPDEPEPPEDEVVDATELVSLGDAAARLPGDTKKIKTALENDRRRKVPGFPAKRREVGRTKLYDLDEVRHYWLTRPAAAGGAG